jgi:hypothetical protein
MDSMESAGCVHFHDANSLSKKLTLETDKPRGVPWYGGLSPGPPSPMAAIYIFEPIHVRNYVLFQDNVPPSAFGRNVMASSAVTPSSQSKAPTSQPTGSTPKATTSTAQSHHSRRSSESGSGSSALSHGSSLPGDIPQYTLRNSNEHQPQATTYARAPAPQAVHHHPPPLPTIMYPPGTIYGYLQPTNPEQSSQVPPPNPQSLPSQTAPSTGETANLGQERVDSDFAEEEEARKRFRELPTQEGSSITDSRTPRNDMKELKERLSEEKGETMKLPDGPSGDQDQKE